MGDLCSKIFHPCHAHYKFELKAGDDKSHSDLHVIDAARKLLNARTYMDDTKMLFAFAGTCIAACLLDWQFWTTIFIFWISRWMKYHSTQNAITGYINGIVGFCSGITVFLIVFYVRDCYGRYDKQWNFACACGGRVFDSVTLGRKYLSKAAGWKLFRLVNAAHLLCYVGLDGSYNETNLFDPVNDKYQLLTPEEVVRLKEIGLVGGNAFREVIAWAMVLLKQETKMQLSDKQMKMIADQLLSFRGSLSRFFHFNDLPTPFSYVHVISFQVFLFLPLYAYTLAYSYKNTNSAGKPLPAVLVLSDSIIESLYLFWYTAAMLSLRTLGQKLSDPLGHNLEDLPVPRYVQTTIVASAKILCAPSVKRTTEGEEADWFTARGLGAPFPFTNYPRESSRRMMATRASDISEPIRLTVVDCEEDFLIPKDDCRRRSRTRTNSSTGAAGLNSQIKLLLKGQRHLSDNNESENQGEKGFCFLTCTADDPVVT